MPRRPCLAVAPEGSLAGETGAPGPAEAAESDVLMPQNLDRTETALRDACMAAGVQYIWPGGVGYEKETDARTSHATRAVSRDKRRKCLPTPLVLSWIARGAGRIVVILVKYSRSSLGASLTTENATARGEVERRTDKLTHSVRRLLVVRT